MSVITGGTGLGKEILKNITLTFKMLSLVIM